MLHVAVSLPCLLVFQFWCHSNAKTSLAWTLASVGRGTAAASYQNHSVDLSMRQKCSCPNNCFRYSSSCAAHQSTLWTAHTALYRDLSRCYRRTRMARAAYRRDASVHSWTHAQTLAEVSVLLKASPWLKYLSKGTSRTSDTQTYKIQYSDSLKA